MKTKTIFRMLSLSLMFALLGSVVMAQTTEEKEKQRQIEEEMKIQQEQFEQQKQQREKEMKIKQIQLEKQQMEMKEQQMKMQELERIHEEQARPSSRARSSARVFSSGGDEGSYYFISGGQENQSQLTLRNSFDGVSDSAEGEFDVDESTSHIRCSINGKVRSGSIIITICYPGGKVFKELSITSSAEMSFTQSLSISDEKKKKYVGSWTYEIEAGEAEGSYMLSFSTH